MVVDRCVVNQMLGDDDIALGIDEHHEFDSARNKWNGGVWPIAPLACDTNGDTHFGHPKSSFPYSCLHH